MHARLARKAGKVGNARRGFSLTDLVVAIAVVGLLAMMQIPFISRARDNARRTACINNMRQLAIAVHNHHDTYKKLPSVAAHFGQKTSLLKMKAAQAEGDAAAQFSFIVRITPYIEEGNLYNEVSRTSDRFKKPAFDDAIEVGDVRPWAVKIATLVCPSFTGKPVATAKEYIALADAGPAGAKSAQPAITNYVALPATHLALLEAEEKADGAIIPSEKPPTFAGFRDGLSNTLLLAESREQDYSSWYDGGCTWVAGLPSSAAAPKLENGKWTLAARTPPPINFGPTQADAKRVYLEQKHWANQAPRSFGPSSEHEGNIVVHAFADGAVRPIGADIDATVYLALITRASNDVIPDDAKAKLGMAAPPGPARRANPGDVKQVPGFEKRTD
jgi:Tfp pilus assembly protein PilE